uniref:Uncharacterized protein n=1 Tax=Wuchereria bancrofti TaxID=6293 RepID=A0AAF5PI70_WUCBA
MRNSNCVKEIRWCRIRMLILLRTLKPSINSRDRIVLKKVIFELIFTG